MNVNRKILSASFAFLLCAGFLFAASPKAVLSKEKPRMFWSIRGTDRNGNPSVVYVQGTIHIGDERLYPLDDAVLSAWRSADRLVGELSSKDMAGLQVAVQRDMFASYRRAAGRNLYDYLSEDEVALVYSLLEPEQADVYAAFEPWVLNSVMTSFQIMDTGFESADGIDMTLLSLAEEEGRLVEGLDTLRTQLAILEFGDYDSQLYILKEALKELLSGDGGSGEVSGMYEAYIADDAAALAAFVSEEAEFDDADKELGEAYMKAIYTDRNTAWAKKIAAWLSEGGTTFIFAGAGHFVGDGSVFDFLREDGTIR